MSNPFVARRPWAVALVTLIFGPFIAMLYLGRGRLAVIYFALDVLVSAIMLFYMPQLVASGAPTGSLWIAELPVTLVGMIHGYILARRRDPEEARPWFARWYAIVGLVLVFPALALCLRTFLYQPFNTVSGSMSPTLVPGEFFFATKFAYDAQAPERGDIIVFRVAYHNASYVKRIVGLPGDRVQLKDGALIIDGAMVPRRRLGDILLDCNAATPCRAAVYQETFPGGRTARIQDRGVTDLDNTDVFVVPQGAYFVLGDDRDNSLDSRSGEIGFVARDAIIGRVDYKYVSAGHWTWQSVH